MGSNSAPMPLGHLGGILSIVKDPKPDNKSLGPSPPPGPPWPLAAPASLAVQEGPISAVGVPQTPRPKPPLPLAPSGPPGSRPVQGRTCPISVLGLVGLCRPPPASPAAKAKVGIEGASPKP